MPLWSVYHSVHLAIKYGTFLFPLFVIDIGLQQPDSKTANRWAVVSLCQLLHASGQIDFFAALLWWLPRDNAPTGGFDFLSSLCSVRSACLLGTNLAYLFLDAHCVTWCLWDVWSGDQHLICESMSVSVISAHASHYVWLYIMATIPWQNFFLVKHVTLYDAFRFHCRATYMNTKQRRYMVCDPSIE